MSNKVHSAVLLFELAQTLLRDDLVLRIKVSHSIIKHLIDTGEAGTAGALMTNAPEDIRNAIRRREEQGRT
jgi:hypothetical protein